jgi:hypothetical protein
LAKRAFPYAQVLSVMQRGRKRKVARNQDGFGHRLGQSIARGLSNFKLNQLWGFSCKTLDPGVLKTPYFIEKN